MWEAFAPSNKHARSDHDARRSPVRVFVVEDEALVAMLIEDAVEAAGCEMVGPFAQLDDAMKAASREKFDCAILDVNIRGGLSYPVATYLVDRGYPILLGTGYRSKSLP